MSTDYYERIKKNHGDDNHQSQDVDARKQSPRSLCDWQLETQNTGGRSGILTRRG